MFLEDLIQTPGARKDSLGTNITPKGVSSKAVNAGKNEETGQRVRHLLLRNRGLEAFRRGSTTAAIRSNPV
jgi:hypothetical protein